MLFALSGRGHRTGDPYHENARKHENIFEVSTVFSVHSVYLIPGYHWDIPLLKLF